MERFVVPELLLGIQSGPLKRTGKREMNNIFKTERNPTFIKERCKFCGKEIGKSNIKKHEKTCHLNPVNKKLCPVCGKVIGKYYKVNDTCSSKCARTFFKEMYDDFGRNNGVGRTYRTKCFMYHKRKCVICGEELVVSVHHYDYDHSNDSPENLIPLCPTHQVYAHSKFKNLIIGKIEEYRKKWIETNRQGVA